jgi:hypothetical protein
MSTTMNNSYITREEFDRRKLLDTPVAWHNPSKKRERIDGVMVEPDSIYLGGLDKPTWEYPVLDAAKYKEDINLFRQGKIDLDRLQHSAYYGDWEDVANEFAERKEIGDRAYNQYRSGNVGIITSHDSPALNTVQILAELQGQDTRNYTLESALTEISTPRLEVSVDSIFGFTATEGIGELMEPDAKKGKWERTKYTLGKDGALIMQSDESQFTNERDVFNIGIQQVNRDLTRILNDRIVAKLESTDVTTIAGADFLAVTSGVRTNDAIAEILKAINVIDDNGGVADTIASDPVVLRAFTSNVQGGATMLNAPVGMTVVGNNVTTNVPGLNNFTWYTDRKLADTRVTVYDKSALLLMRGPSRTEQFRDSRRGADAYITRTWRGIHIIDTSRIRGITGVL